MREFNVQLALFDRKTVTWEEPTDAIRARGTGWRRRVQEWLLRLARRFGAAQYFEPRSVVRSVRLDHAKAGTTALQALEYLRDEFCKDLRDIRYVLMGPEQFAATAEEVAGLPHGYGLAGINGELTYRGIPVVLVPWMRGILPITEIKVYQCS